MPRLVALLVLAGVAVSTLRPRPAVRCEIATSMSRNLTDDEVALLFTPSPSKALH